MSGFTADWLELREPFDIRSRSEDLVLVLRKQLPRRPLEAVDLGTGTAANIRYLAPRLGGVQSWRAVDNDPLLLGGLPLSLHGPDFNCRVSPRQLDLATDLDTLPLADHSLVTASALLDLVSHSWLQQLAGRCAEAEASVLFALTYDGRSQFWPNEPDDDWVCELVNQHQLGEKEFGPALGPGATQRACELFQSRGFETHTVPSDWIVEPQESPLQRVFVEGWLKAALEIAPDEAQRIEAWGHSRMHHIAAGISRLLVGHQDFIAWPTQHGV
jgi:hypothetical protein